VSKIDFSDQATLIHELEANLWEAWSTFGRGKDCALHDEGDMLWFETPIPIIPYNGILKFQVEKNTDHRIDGLIRHFSDRGSSYFWIVTPSSAPPDLPDRLVRRGLQEIEVIPAMTRLLSDLPAPPPLPDDIEVREVLEEDDTIEWLEFAAWRWNIPDEFKQLYGSVTSGFHTGKPDARFRLWQAWRGGKPVSKAAMYIGSGSAGMYGVATRPEAGRLGLARILTIKALNEGRRQGLNLAVLHSTPMAERLYQSLGFEKQAEFRLFAPEAVHI
jgi:ribosomal protein S18 acetylase RimI-like enzyme